MAKDFVAELPYWLDPHDGSGPNPEYDRELFFGHQDEDIHMINVHDIRGQESAFSLDTHGFEAITLPKKDRITTFDEDDTEYNEELSILIKSRTGAKQVLFFAKNLRALPRDALKPGQFIPGKPQSPAPRPHVDFSPSTAYHQAVKRSPGAETLLNSCTRWQILGIWRPIKLVQRDPLVLTDSRTIPDSDYVELSRDRTLGPGSKMAHSLLKCGEKGSHRWHYWSDMTPNELFLFKNYDSKQDIDAWRCGHTSVAIPGTEDLPVRESLEVRALVGY